MFHVWVCGSVVPMLDILKLVIVLFFTSGMIAMAMFNLVKCLLKSEELMCHGWDCRYCDLHLHFNRSHV